MLECSASSSNSEHYETATSEIDSQEKIQSKSCQSIMSFLGAARPLHRELLALTHTGLVART